MYVCIYIYIYVYHCVYIYIYIYIYIYTYCALRNDASRWMCATSSLLMGIHYRGVQSEGGGAADGGSII